MALVVNDQSGEWVADLDVEPEFAIFHGFAGPAAAGAERQG